MTVKKNNSETNKKPRKTSGLQGFGEVKNEIIKEETKEPKKRGPKLIINEDSYRTVPKGDKLILPVPDYGVELHIEGKIFTSREFHRLFPCAYKDFDIIIDYKKEQVSFHIPWEMANNLDIYVRYRKKGTFEAYKYDIKAQK